MDQLKSETCSSPGAYTLVARARWQKSWDLSPLVSGQHLGAVTHTVPTHLKAGDLLLHAFVLHRDNGKIVLGDLEQVNRSAR